MRNNTLVFRLRPGSDLLLGLIEQCVKRRINAGCIISAVGCVKVVCFRTADGRSVYNEVNDFEVTALSGTISADGPHIHIQLCDENLRSIGGHLLEGTIVNTTMEIVILDLQKEYELSRSYDEETGYDELEVSKK